MTQIHYNISRNKNWVTIDKKYIPKLQLHQHSLLTRKVFFRHNFQHWCSSLDQLDHLCLQVIFIFGSGSSLDLDHHRTSSLDLDHHHQTGSGSSLDLDLDLDHLSIWIITTRSGSSLDLDHHRLSSLDLDHYYWIWIITGCHHWIWIVTSVIS